MGSGVSCNKCTTTATGSVVNLSDALVLRIVDGVEEPKKKNTGPVGEEDWIEKIKCLDDAHSKAYGLSVKDLEAQMLRMEKYVEENRLKIICSKNDLQDCYKRYPCRTLKCAKEVTKFVTCIDAERLQKIQNLVDAEHERIKKEKNEKRR